MEKVCQMWTLCVYVSVCVCEDWQNKLALSKGILRWDVWYGPCVCGHEDGQLQLGVGGGGGEHVGIICSRTARIFLLIFIIIILAFVSML